MNNLWLLIWIYPIGSLAFLSWAAWTWDESRQDERTYYLITAAVWPATVLVLVGMGLYKLVQYLRSSPNTPGEKR